MKKLCLILISLVAMGIAADAMAGNPLPTIPKVPPVSKTLPTIPKVPPVSKTLPPLPKLPPVPSVHR